VLFLAIAPVVVACAGGGGAATYAELRARAAFDLNCNRKQLQLVPLADNVAGVRGCGQQATYVESCFAGGYTSTFGGAVATDKECKWVMDASRGAGRPASTSTSPSAAANAPAAAPSAPAAQPSGAPATAAARPPAPGTGTPATGTP
jgi:hypothetical protein